MNAREQNHYAQGINPVYAGLQGQSLAAPVPKSELAQIAGEIDRLIEYAGTVRQRQEQLGDRLFGATPEPAMGTPNAPVGGQVETIAARLQILSLVIAQLHDGMSRLERL